MKIVLLFAIIVISVFGQSLLPGNENLIFGDDIHRQYYLYRQFLNTSLAQGIIPFWNPYNFSGTPFLANPVVNIFYPPNWLYIVAPLNFAYSWHIAVHVFWAMLGMYIFRVQGAGNRAGAFVSGVIFGLSGFFMARSFAGHVDVIAAAAWMPWVLYGLKKNTLWAICALTLQLFAGYQTMAFFTLIAAGIVAVFDACKSKHMKPLLRLGFVVLSSIGLFSVQLLPQQEFFQNSIRAFDMPYSWNSYGSIEWKSLLQLLSPFYFGNQYSYAGPPPNLPEHAMFVGLGGLTLAIIGLIRPVGPIWLITLFGLWMSLGPNAPIDLQKVLWNITPFYQYIRIPPRHLILVVFGLAVLAGAGLGRLHKSLRSLKLCIVVLVTLEMIFFARNFIELKPIPEANYDQELVKIVTSTTDRVLPNFGVWVPPRDLLPFASTTSLGYFSVTGYDVMILKNYYEFIDFSLGKKTSSILEHDVQIPYLDISSQVLDFLNIKYVLVPRDYDPLGGKSTDRFSLLRNEPTYRLYENSTVQPKYVFRPTCDKNSVEVKEYSLNRVEIQVSSACDGVLESAEVYYPGWEATIDGEKTPIRIHNHAFRSVAVSKGEHHIIFYYNPKIYVYGGILSIVSMMILLYVSKFTNIFGYMDHPRSNMASDEV